MQKSFFSIIVPTYERPKALKRCLQAISQIDYPQDRFEVIIVDDGSIRPPYDLISFFDDQIDIRLITQTHSGPAKARNNGAGHARGEFLVFIDDDCMLSAKWLKKIEGYLSTATPDCAVGGCVVNAYPANQYAMASQLIVEYFYSHYNKKCNNARFLASNNLAVPRDRFMRLGGFDTSFPYSGGEDREFCERWLEAGHKLVFSKAAVVYHAHELTFKSFVRQHFNYGQGAFRFRKAGVGRGNRLFRFEPLSFYVNLIIYPYLKLEPYRRVPFSVLQVISQLANFGGFVWEGIHMNTKNPYKD